jgi:uncharacterized protein (TIGR02246 family)
MKGLIALATAALLTVTLIAQDAERQGPTDAQVQAIVNDIRAGWEAGSGLQFARSFAPNAEQVAPHGGLIRGRDQIAKVHDELFGRVFQGSKMRLSVDHVRALRPDVAVVHGVGQATMADGNVDRNRFSAVLVQHGNVWMIESLQLTPIQQMP